MLALRQKGQRKLVPLKFVCHAAKNLNREKVTGKNTVLTNVGMRLGGFIQNLWLKKIALFAEKNLNRVNVGKSIVHVAVIMPQ